MERFSQKILGTAKIASSSLKAIYSEKESLAIIRRLIESVLSAPYTALLMNPERIWTLKEYTQFCFFYDQLLLGKPLQYVLGQAHFFGRDFEVGTAVLIPRPETEELVDWILSECNSGKGVDIGTGSGCIAITLALESPHLSMTGIDNSPQALNIAKKNAANLGADVSFELNNILSETDLKFGDSDLIVSNPPYVTCEDKKYMVARVLEYEPTLALFPNGDDPLIFYKRISHLAKYWLKPGGRLYFEINEKFGPEVVEILQKEKFSAIELRKDLQGKDRMVRAINCGDERFCEPL